MIAKIPQASASLARAADAPPQRTGRRANMKFSFLVARVFLLELG